MTKQITKHVWIAVLLASACSKTNPYYCADHPDQNCSIDAPGAPTCQGPADCSGALPVCDLQQHACVQCTPDMPTACSGLTPTCGTDDMCHACKVDNDCPSNVCLADGSCGTDSNVAYVKPDGNDTNPCTQAQPCQHVMTAVAKARPYVKIQGTIDEAVVLDSVDVTLIGAPGAKLTRSSSGVVMEVRGTSAVTVERLSIADGLGAAGVGISVPAGTTASLTLDQVQVTGNGGVGLNIQSGSLAMSRCVVSGNQGGGASVASDFRITNSLFVANGNALSNIGGLLLSAAATDVFEFNTVADNLSSAASVSARGINCALPLALANTIVHNNLTAANCTFDYSLFDTGTTVANHNKAGDPVFKNTDATTPSSPSFYRLESTSAAIDSADPASTMAVDIDGNPRPQGGTSDIGADEVMP